MEARSMHAVSISIYNILAVLLHAMFCNLLERPVLEREQYLPIERLII